MILPKYAGFDIELATSGTDPQRRPLDNWHVTSLVLDALPQAAAEFGVAVWSRSDNWSRGSTDSMRRWLNSSVACVYGDLGHVEICSAVTTDPRHLAASELAALQLIERARSIAEQRQPPGTDIVLTAHNSQHDNPAISWGQHFNLSISPGLYDLLFKDPQRPGVSGFVTSAVAAAAVFFGSGNLLSKKNGHRRFSLSARAHHVNHVITHETTRAWNRGILNSRREAHAENCDRLHLISLDASPLSAALRCCFLQCVTAAAEEGFNGPILAAPVDCLQSWSFGLDPKVGQLNQAEHLVDGRRLRLNEYMHTVTFQLLEMVQSGLITEEACPHADELLPKILQLCDCLGNGDIAGCARHLDWAAKLIVILDACDRLSADLDDPRVILADQNFHHTNPERGAMYALWSGGFVDPLVSAAYVQQCLEAPPPDTRDWGRGSIIQRFATSNTSVIQNIDWSEVSFRSSGSKWWSRDVRLHMSTLDSFNRNDFGPVMAAANNVEDLLRRLDS